MLNESSIHDAVAPSADERSARLAALTRINTDDMLGAFGLEHVRRGRRLLELLCRRPARRFARQVLAFDDAVGESGLAAGGAWALTRFVAGWTASGQGNLPRTGPLLVVANHPGLYDTTLLFAAIARPDLRVIAADRPFLRTLSNTARHLLFLDDSPASRLRLIRAAARHLQRGGSILTFPGGEIEPDPAVLPGAVDALERWSASLELLVRLAPRLTIVPAVVGGVLAPGAQRHPLTHIRRTRKARERLGAMLQLTLPGWWPVTPSVVFGCPIQAPAQTSESGSRRADGQGPRARQAPGARGEVQRQIQAEVRRLIEERYR